jgi:hypothetical protein
VGWYAPVLKNQKKELEVIHERIVMEENENNKHIIPKEEFLNSKKKAVSSSLRNKKKESKNTSNHASSGNKSEMARKYESAYKKLFDNFPKWKQTAIVESLASKRTDDDLLNYFIKDVIAIAENDLEKHIN